MTSFNNIQSRLNNQDVTSLIGYFQAVSGFQRSNRFKVNIDMTPLRSLGITPQPLFANNIQIPSQTINYYRDTMSPSGSYIDIPVKREYDERFLIEFIVDSNWNTRKFFDDWINSMFKDEGEFRNSAFVVPWNKIKTKIQIYALDLNGNTNRQITLYDAWPSTILPTQMMNDAPNDYLTLVVDMNYRYYETSVPDQG